MRHAVGDFCTAVSCLIQAAQLDDLRGHTLVFAKTGISSMDRKDDVDDLVVCHWSAAAASLRPLCKPANYLHWLGIVCTPSPLPQ